MNKFFDYNLVCDIQAGASVGGLIGLLIIIGVIIFFVILIRRRRHAESFIKKEVELSLFSLICFHYRKINGLHFIHCFIENINFLFKNDILKNVKEEYYSNNLKQMY